MNSLNWVLFTSPLFLLIPYPDFGLSLPLPGIASIASGSNSNYYRPIKHKSHCRRWKLVRIRRAVRRSQSALRSGAVTKKTANFDRPHRPPTWARRELAVPGKQGGYGRLRGAAGQPANSIRLLDMGMSSLVFGDG